MYEADQRFSAMYLISAIAMLVVHVLHNRGEQLAELQVHWAMRIMPLAARLGAHVRGALRIAAVRTFGGRTGTEPPTKTACGGGGDASGGASGGGTSCEPRRASSACVLAVGHAGAELSGEAKGHLYDVLAEALPSAPGGFGNVHQPGTVERERLQPLLQGERRA